MKIGGNKIETIKELLGEELYTQVSEKIGDKKLILNDGSFVPKNRFNEVNELKNSLQEQLTERDNQLKELSKSVKGNEELLTQIKELQEANKTTSEGYEKKIRDLRLDNEIKLKLKESKAKYEDLLMGKFDREKLTINEDGSIGGLTEQLAILQANYKDMFGEKVIDGHVPNKTTTSSNAISKEKFNSMSYKERVNLFNTNPALYRQLTE